MRARAHAERSAYRAANQGEQALLGLIIARAPNRPLRSIRPTRPARWLHDRSVTPRAPGAGLALPHRVSAERASSPRGAAARCDGAQAHSAHSGRTFSSPRSAKQQPRPPLRARSSPSRPIRRDRAPHARHALCLALARSSSRLMTSRQAYVQLGTPSSSTLVLFGTTSKPCSRSSQCGQAPYSPGKACRSGYSVHRAGRARRPPDRRPPDATRRAGPGCRAAGGRWRELRSPSINAPLCARRCGCRGRVHARSPGDGELCVPLETIGYRV